MELFLSQHAVLHSAAMAHSELWSLVDEILDDMIEAHVRRIPHNCSHSVAWLIWHILVAVRRAAVAAHWSKEVLSCLAICGRTVI